MIGSLITAATILVVTAVCAALYVLPLLLGWARRVPNLGSVAVVNILLGWTLAGWAVALAMALRSARPDGPVVQVVQHLPPATPPPAPPPWRGPPGSTLPPAPRPGTAPP